MSSSSSSNSDDSGYIRANLPTTSLRVILDLLQLLAECTNIASNLFNSIADIGHQSTAPTTPADGPALASLPSTPSPMSTTSILTDDEPEVQPPPLILEHAPQLSTLMPLNTRRLYERVHAMRSADFNPSGPFDLFVPGELTLDGRVQVMYNDFLYDLPHPGTTEQLYLITRGLRVGIFASWARTGPYVNSVRNSVYVKVDSIVQGELLLHECIDQGIASWLQPKASN